MNNSRSLAGEEAGLRLNRTNAGQIWQLGKGSEREMLSSLTLGFDQTTSRQQTFSTDSIFLTGRLENIGKQCKQFCKQTNNFIKRVGTEGISTVRPS